MRQKIAAGNWKMNLLPQEGATLANAIYHADRPSGVLVIIAAPYLHLPLLRSAISPNQEVWLAAQNCHQENSGAYTGEISTPMLKSLGVEAVILGHSERREYFGETDEWIAKKIQAALTAGLTPIYCCGEKLEERKDGREMQVVQAQLQTALKELSADQAERLIVAYEPVWAIGTGETATPQQAQEMHAFIRSTLSELWTSSAADHIPILYGGSVKPANASALFGQADVDGGLIGGASLDANSFLSICKAFG